MIATAHQPNFLLAESITSKIAASDVVIWLDEVQYSKGGWTNRNMLPDGTWVTVPVEKHCAFKPVNRVKIGDPFYDWRERVSAQLLRAWPGHATEHVVQEVQRPYGLLVGLNVAVLRAVVPQLAPGAAWAFQSHLGGGHALPAVSDSPAELKPISYRLAAMVEEVGCDTYLSGPSGRRYLDEKPFRDRGIAVDYWEFAGPNRCALELVAA